MAFLNEQGLQHLVDKINVRSSKTLPDNAPDGTIIIDPDEDTEIFNVSIDVDTALSATSTNPVQNKVIKVALDGKLGKNETAARATQDDAGNTISTTYASKADVSALLSTKLGVTATAYAANRDGAGNNIVNTYAKKTDIPDIPNITVDAELSSTSTNPVQNKVIHSALANKLTTADILSGFALLGGATNIRWREGTQFVGSINAANYSGTARAATYDGAGNKIVDTYAKKTDIPNITVDAELSDTSTNPIQNKVVKTAIDTVTASIPTKVSDLENDAGYLTQHQPLDNYAKTNQDNNFSVLQTFQSIRTAREDMPYQWDTTTPTSHCGFMIVSANTTIDLSKIFDSLPKDNYMAVYTCVIQASSNYSLTITGASTVRYIGSASDCSIKAPGVLLNVLCFRSGTQGEYTTACVSVMAFS